MIMTDLKSTAKRKYLNYAAHAGAPRMSSQFHQEFPSLQAAGEAEKPGEQEDEPYGPGPSLRPQSKNFILYLYYKILYAAEWFILFLFASE